MLFNSFAFAVFFPIALAGGAVLRGSKRRIWLVLLSYLFYGWGVPWHCLLLFASTFLDFHVGRWIFHASCPRRRRNYLLLSLCGNLGLLAAFKYSSFLIGELNGGLSLLGMEQALPLPALALPIGISFYTFQTLSYTIDIYRKKLEPEKSFSTFALFVAFFPQLVAGPIERATHLLPQLRKYNPVSTDQRLSALCRILWGLAKKVVVADWLAIYVDETFAIPGFGGPWAFLLALNAFAFQIYLDFSAYSDIAIGVSRLLGIELRENFRWPYLSRNIAEFWQRWHISLSTWLRDYLYIPLGGNQRGRACKVRNLLLVMVLGGLWHGAAYHYIFWGLWIGTALALHAVLKPYLRRKIFRLLPNPVFHFFSVLVTYLTILSSWIFFRSKDLPQAFDGFRVLHGDWSTLYFGHDPDTTLRVSLMLGLAALVHVVHGSGIAQPTIQRAGPVRLSLFIAGVIIFIAMFHAPETTQFLYFRF